MCFQQHELAQLTLIAGNANEAREHYRRMLGEACKLDKIHLRHALVFLQLFTRLFPARNDITEISNWFENQLSAVV